MASPAAVLSVLVQAEGIAKTTRQVDGLHGNLGKADKTVGKFGRSLEDTGKRGSKALSGLKSAAGLAVGALGVAGLAGAVGTAVGEFQEARKVGAQTNAVIKSTGGVANVSAKHVADLATAISKKVGIDDEAIQSGSNLLLTFKGVRNEVGKGNDIFDQATQTITDMSVSLKQGLKPSAIQLGKALNDPIKGITALSRVGVTFTEGQKKQIAAMVKAGDTLGAQKIILKELKSEFGGSAAAAATPLDKLKVTALNLAEAAGSVLVPAIDKVATFLSKLVNQMIEGKSTGGAIIEVFKGLGGVIGGVVGAIKGIVKGFQEGNAAAVILVATVGALTAAFVTYKTIMFIAASASKALAAAQVLINVAMSANPVVLVVAAIAALVAGLVIAYEKSETFRKIVNALWDAIKTAAGAVWDFLKSLAGLPGKLYDAGKAITEGVINGVKALPGLLLDAAKWLGDKIIDGIKGYIGLYKAAGSWVLDRVVDGFKVVTSLLATVGGWLKNRIVALAQAEVAGLKAVGTWLLDRVVGGFKVVTGLLATVGGWLKNRISDFIKLEVDGLTTVGSWIVNRVVDGFKVVTKSLGSAGEWLKNRFVDAFNGVKDGFIGIGSTLIGWVADGFRVGVNAVIDLANKIIDVVNKIPGVPNIGHIGHIGGAGGGKGAPGDPTPHKKAFAHGGMVGGSGAGDKVPLHIGGQLAAMVEPGEFVSVANRKATAALMGVNSAVPRYASGGVLSGLSGIADLGLSALSVGNDAGHYIRQLPGAGGLGWLEGLGKYALGHVTKWIKDKIGSIASSGGGGAVPKGSVKSWLTEALKITGHFSAANLAALYGRAIQESGGRPHAINLWDINAQQGHPSKGLLQTIDSTFASYMLKGHGDIWNPIDNAIAAIRYMFAAYGHIVGPSGTGYAKGGFARGWGVVGEQGPELVNFGARGGQVYSNQDSRAMLGGRSGPLVHIEHAEFGNQIDVNSFAAKLGFKLATA